MSSKRISKVEEVAEVVKTAEKVSTVIGQDENKKSIELAVKYNMPILLVGETGTGKTSLIREIANNHGKKMIRINLNGQTSTYEFVGKWLIKDKETVWVDGVLIQAMREGWWILCDEINAALPEILFVLHSLLDDDRFVLLSEKDGELVKPHPDFRFFATMNPMDEYAGTKELNKAFVSRFGMVLEVSYPLPEVEQQILRDRTGIGNDDAVAMAEFARSARKEKHDGKLYHTVSTRDLIFWASMIKDLGINKAFMYTILFKAHKDDHKLLATLWEGVGGKIKELVKEFGTSDFTSLIELIATKASKITTEWKAIEVAREELKTEKENMREEVLQAMLGDLGSSIKKKIESTKPADLKMIAFEKSSPVIKGIDLASGKDVTAGKMITADDILGAVDASSLPF